MAFLRISRDKRGYENFYLIQPTTRRGKMPRLLYWFRTPPNIQVGREPFDPEVRRVLERQNPDVTFDWTAIMETPIPPVVEPERWRERRRMERASRQSAAEDDQTPEPVRTSAPVAAEASAYVNGEDTVEELPSAISPTVDAVPSDGPASADQLLVAQTDPTNGPAPASNGAEGTPAGAPAPRSRRRRRRRRGARPKVAQDPSAPGSGAQVETSHGEASDGPLEGHGADVQDSGEPESDESEPSEP